MGIFLIPAIIVGVVLLIGIGYLVDKKVKKKNTILPEEKSNKEVDEFFAGVSNQPLKEEINSVDTIENDMPTMILPAKEIQEKLDEVSVEENLERVEEPEINVFDLTQIEPTIPEETVQNSNFMPIDQELKAPVIENAKMVAVEETPIIANDNFMPMFQKEREETSNVELPIQVGEIPVVSQDAENLPKEEFKVEEKEETNLNNSFEDLWKF